MVKSSIVFMLFLITFFSLQSCKKDKTADEEDQQFCTFLTGQNFDATGPFIDTYLSSLHDTDTDKNLEKLRIWLENKECINSVQIICNSCIETYPPQSELRVTFSVNGKQVSLTLDILMDTPMRFRTFHE